MTKVIVFVLAVGFVSAAQAEPPKASPRVTLVLKADAPVEDVVLSLIREVCVPYGASTEMVRAIASDQGFKPLSAVQVGRGVQPSKVYAWQVRPDLTISASSTGPTNAAEREAALQGKTATAPPPGTREPSSSAGVLGEDTADCHVSFSKGDVNKIRNAIGRMPILGRERGAPVDETLDHGMANSFWPVSEKGDWRAVNFSRDEGRKGAPFTQVISVNAPIRTEHTS